MYSISIFIAGRKELKAERDRLTVVTNNLNVNYDKKGKDVHLTLASYENYGDNQKEYNAFITNHANIVIFVIDGKFGEKTEKEYELAVKTWYNNNKPKIITFVRGVTQEIENTINKYREKYKRGENDEIDYFVEYENIDKLGHQTEQRIDDYVSKYIEEHSNFAEEHTNFINKIWNKVTKIMLLFIILVLLGIFAFYSLDNKKYIVFSSVELPANLVSDGIDNNFVKNQIVEAVKECGDASQNKFNGIITDLSNNANNDINKALPQINTEVKEIANMPMPTVIKGIRKIIGRDDIVVSFKIVESDSAFIGLVEMLDKQHYKKNIKENKASYPSKYECILSLINKCAAYITQAYEPMVSVLYDYNISEGLEEYQQVTPWLNCLYSDVERENILQESANSNNSNAEYCLLLLGNYFEKCWINKSSPEFARKAYKYYDEFNKKNNNYHQGILSKLTILKEQIDGNNLQYDKNISLPDILVRNGIIANNIDCSQLIIVTDEEGLNHKAKLYYKATLYSYEMKDGKWNEKTPPFKVNLGIKGIANANQKIEGDLKTPSGLYPITFVFGSSRDIDTKMNFIEIDKNHVWVCDTSSSDYNKLIIDKHGQYKDNPKNERLYRTDYLYKYAIAIDYNINPIVKGKGSAIFIHIERYNNHRTAGCISIPEEKIIELIKWLDPNKKPYIYICKHISHLKI